MLKDSMILTKNQIAVENGLVPDSSDVTPTQSPIFLSLYRASNHSKNFKIFRNIVEEEPDLIE